MENQKYQIAIVDDEPEIAIILKEIIEENLNFNCEIEIFNDPLNALSRLQDKKFDILSLDHRMPKLTGMDLVKILRTSEGLNTNIRILLLTGYREEAACNKNYLLDGVFFLEKPIDEQKYIYWINVLLKTDKSAA